MKILTGFSWLPITVRFMLPVCLLLLFLAPAGGFLYRETLLLVKKEVIKNKLNLLQQSQNDLDVRLERLRVDIRRIVDNPRISYLAQMRDPYQQSNTYKLLEAKDSLTSLNLDDPLLLQYYVVLQRSGLVMNKRFAADYRDFYDHYFRYADMSFEAWREWISDNYFYETFLPVRPTVMEGSPRQAITYMTSIGYKDSFQGQVVALLNVGIFLDILRTFNENAGGWSYIADASGQIVVSLSDSGESPVVLNLKPENGAEEMIVNGTPMVVTHTRSDYNGWTYVSAQPASVLLEKVGYFQKTFAAVMMLFAALGILAAFLMTYRSAKPLSAILSTIGAGARPAGQRFGNIFGLIQHTLTDLMGDRDQLRLKLKEQQPLVRSALIQRLLSAEMIWDEQSRLLLAHVGLELKGNYFAAGIVSFQTDRADRAPLHLEQMDVNRLLTRELLLDVFQRGVQMHDVSANRIAFILTSGETSRRHCKLAWSDAFKLFKERLYRKGRLEAEIAVGGIYADINAVSRSYEEARRALELMGRNKDNIIMWHDDCPEVSDMFEYGPDYEQKLVHFVKSGSTEGICRIMDELYRINFHERSLSPPVLRFLLMMIWATYFKITVDPSVRQPSEEIIGEIERLASIREIQASFRRLERRFVALSDKIDRNKRDVHADLMHEIAAYLDSHYDHPELSLTLLADRFQMSEAHLSRFIKEQSGVNFFEHLERLRMTRAKELLIGTTMTIREIGAAVGYNSTNTFSRAFKRYYGASASTYRERLSWKEEHSCN